MLKDPRRFLRHFLLFLGLLLGNATVGCDGGVTTPQYPLTVTGAGTGNGSVTGGASIISCDVAAGVTGNQCSGTYDEGTQVTLTAAADAGSSFGGWSGACSGTGTCQVTMNQAQSVTARFELQHELAVAGAGTGNGSVTSDVAGVSCTLTAGVASNDCNELYDEGTAVTLTAAADAGSRFDSWGGACSGTGACQVTMDQARSVTATFVLQHELIVDGAGVGNGSVTSDLAGISCTVTAGIASDDCSELYDGGTVVTLTAVAGGGSVFDSWSGACTGTGTCQVTMTQPHNVTATFESCTLTNPTDTDGDRLPDCVESNTMVFVNQLDTGTDPTDPDTDGDAISDGDEVLGTLAGLALPQMGTNPLKQDILIEYDWFDDALDCGAHSHQPTAVAVFLVASAFANAPVVNPDGSSGINFIQDFGQGGVFTGGGLIVDADGVLVGGVNDAEFLGYKSTNFDSNRNGYFHYTILPHRYNTNSTSSGQAELSGDDMIVSLYCAGSDQNIANTIMHELGHNLSLQHGGAVGTNYKPNYNSVMNYKYQFPGIDNNCTPPGDGVLDYSIGVRPPLDENDLDETQGICGNPPGPPWDWNQDGDAVDVGLMLDINLDNSEVGDGLLEVLEDYNDWASLVFGGISDADGAPLLQVRQIISCENPAPTGGR